MAAKARSIYYQMDTLINNLRKEVNSFGGYVDITKSMGIKPYIVRKKDEFPNHLLKVLTISLMMYAKLLKAESIKVSSNFARH